jgi:HEAT repeat protein
MDVQTQTDNDIRNLVNLLESSDDKVRRKARKSLVTLGKPAVSFLSGTLQSSKVYKARWEAAKALGAIGNVKAIPSLVKALEDPETDVVWLAAEALKKFRKVAWKELLNALVQRGAESVILRNGAHHVLRNQKEKGFNDLLDDLRKSLESGSAEEGVPIAAFNILKRMRVHSKHD